MTRSVHRGMRRRGIERHKPSPGCRCFLNQKAIWRVVVDPGMHTSLCVETGASLSPSPPVVAGMLTGRPGSHSRQEYDGKAGLARGTGEAGDKSASAALFMGYGLPLSIVEILVVAPRRHRSRALREFRRVITRLTRSRALGRIAAYLGLYFCQVGEDVGLAP